LSSIPRPSLPGVHVFGLLATALMTDIIQLATGYPTPFFLTVCQPNYTLPGISCDQDNYITQDICSGKDLYAILSARKAFPSQHATLSGFAAVYISMYLNSVISSSTKLVKPVLVFGYCLAAGIAGLTQITQHRCHPRDVYVGYALGAGIGVYLSLYAVGNFRSSEEDCLPQPGRRAASPPQQQREVVVRGRAQGGHVSQHGSLYRSKTPRPSDSREELGTGRCKVRREKASVASLKRASADVELLAPRCTMGKETMVTFSNTLPRVANSSSSTSPPGDDPSNQRHMAFHLSFDPRRSQPRLRPPLVQEWRQQRSVIAMSKQHGPISSSAKGSDSTSSCGGGSSTGSSESPYYRVPSDHDSHTGSVTGSIVTIDAHAPHHPVVRVSSSVSNGTLGARVTAAGNGTPWERRNTTSGSVGEQGQRGALQRQEKVSAPDYREYRTLPVKSDSICSSSPSETDSSTLPPPPQPISSPLPPPSPPPTHPSLPSSPLLLPSPSPSSSRSAVGQLLPPPPLYDPPPPAHCLSPQPR
uniref:phospholipid phosphatase-related protein type 3-like n=1 Tax=Oncorhynchus gorbuscha TaxID=8017 RepID=UPI001EAED4B6